MSQVFLWGWDAAASVWRKVLVDTSGKIKISDVDPFEVVQDTPADLKHLPHGYYAAGPSYLPLAVDSAGKLQLAIASLPKLDDIDDVYVPSPTDEYLLYWDAPNSRWACRALVDADIPAAIARDTEVATAVSDHAALLTGIHGLALGARVYHSANQTITTATATILAFNSERFDTDTIHDTTTNNSRLTCKTAGKYIIVATLDFASNAVGRRLAGFILNGTAVIGQQEWDTSQVAATLANVVTIYDLAVNDYVEARVYQSSGGDLAVRFLDNYSPEFMMQRIG